LEYDWENSVGCWICSTSQAMRKVLGAELSREGMTLRQWEVLAWLSCNGCGSQSELAEAMGIEPHTLAGVLSRMERDGLLERRPSEKDRRKNTILPTQQAEEAWARVTRICHEIRHRAVQGFSEQELEQLRDMCRRIRENVAVERSDAILVESPPFPVEAGPARLARASRR
jgi:MarR family transcriptional regulator for hemolysin